MNVTEIIKEIEELMGVPRDYVVSNNFLDNMPLIFRQHEELPEEEMAIKYIVNLYALLFNCPFDFFGAIEKGGSFFRLISIKNYGIELPTNLPEIYEVLKKNAKAVYEHTNPKQSPLINRNIRGTVTNTYLDIDITTRQDGRRSFSEFRSGTSLTLNQTRRDEIQEKVDEYNDEDEEYRDFDQLRYNIQELIEDYIQDDLVNGDLDTEYYDEESYDADYDSEELSRDETDYDQLTEQILEDFS